MAYIHTNKRTLKKRFLQVMGSVDEKRRENNELACKGLREEIREKSKQEGLHINSLILEPTEE